MPDNTLSETTPTAPRMIHRWARNRAAGPVAALTLALAAFAALVSPTIATPQLSGGHAALTLAAATAALAGALFPRMLTTPDPIAEARSPRRLRPLRHTLGLTLLTLGALAFLLPGGRAPDWSAAHTYLLVTAASLALTRYAGTLASVTVFAGYVGACLFAGAPPVGPAHWWAVPLQQAQAPTTTTALLLALAVTAVLTTFRTPRLPADHRSPLLAPGQALQIARTYGDL